MQDILGGSERIADPALPPIGIPGVAEPRAVDHAGVDGHGSAVHLVLGQELGEFDGAVKNDVDEALERNFPSFVFVCRSVEAPFEIISALTHYLFIFRRTRIMIVCVYL